jgi:two-component system, chemotaxis family, CheB/CheR fusion protein
MANDDIQEVQAAVGPIDGQPYVVGIGASAGGLAALQTLFGAMPVEPGFACVVVVRLSPQHESHLVELMQPYTSMRVQQVRTTVPLLANNVYVIPPNANLDAIDTHLRLADLEPRRGARAPIDHFVRTLAHAHDGHAAAVILTGSGSDGSLGLRQIRECGGFTIAQDPEEAEYASMPHSAIQTGAVDRVLKLRDIPAALASWCATRPRLPPNADVIDAGQSEALRAINALLLARTAHDFSHFKRSLMLRKIGRRMRLRGAQTLDAYVEVLRTLEDEPRALTGDLLFTVTEFFDDTDLFARIENDVLPPIFADKVGKGSRVRVWSIGCSTGEEAYSLAMLLIEEASRLPDAPGLQVFASDLSADSLAHAREGIYPLEVAATVPPDRLERFFTEREDSYAVTQQVRDMVVFALHNVLRDPPFGHVDLIVCRSLLSELQPQIRRALLALFHFALEPGGRLVVGPLDSLGEELLFDYVDRRAGVLKPRLGTPRRVPPAPSSPTAPARSDNTVAQDRAKAHAAADLASIHYRMMERYTSPSLLLGSDDTIVHYSTSAGGYVAMPGGEPTRDVYRLLREPLASVLRRVVERARSEGVPCDSEPFIAATDYGPRRVVVRVQPPAADSGDLTLVVFEELGAASAAPKPDPRQTLMVSALQSELERIQRRLHDVVVEHSDDRDELTDTNEQLQSANEEFRFLLDQLAASKEEIQAANEELMALDFEHRRRVDELGQLSGDLHHLLQATGIATLFLDRDLKIVRFTPQLGELFNVRDADVGRPLADITNRLDYESLEDDARRTLADLRVVDREIRSRAGRWYLMRMLPYLTSTHQVEGVALTLVDITERKQAEQELRDADRRKDEFLALLAHELRNPLAPIVAGIDLLRQSKDKPQLLEQVTATMERQAKQLVRLVDDLLELSRVSGGRLRLRKSRVRLRDVMRDAVASVRPIVERQRHELRVNVPEEPIELEADSARLTQVFANLLTNAARYTPEGGRITIAADREGQEVVVTVTDNGIGIPPPALARIFEMFYQGDEGRPMRGGGLGIGLTLARSLVEMHGGTITAASPGSDRGSAFTVRLPVAERLAAGDATEHQAAPKALGGHRVLIVDDNTDAARTLGMLVETLGENEVHVANNGSDALRIAEERRPDIVLLDLKMPGMDGYEVARRLRSESWGRDLTLVAVTGWTLEDHKRRSRDAGFDRHLTKPADVDALAAVLSSPARETRPSV